MAVESAADLRTEVLRTEGITIMEDMGGNIWSLAVIVGPVALALALAYGLLRWSSRSRSPALKEARDEATREMYHGTSTK